MDSIQTEKRLTDPCFLPGVLGAGAPRPRANRWNPAGIQMAPRSLHPLLPCPPHAGQVRPSSKR